MQFKFVLFVFLGVLQFGCPCQIKTRNFWNFDPHISALILARGGSKGIPLKNLALLGNKTLLKNSLEVILETKTFNSVWVSTENIEIYKEASKVSEDVNVHWRSDESATDEATSIFAVKEFLQFHPEIDVLVLVQCTSPFIKPKYLIDALQLIRKGAECVFSVTRSFKLRWTLSGDKLLPLNLDPSNRKRRQNWSGELIENGMFYIANRLTINKGAFQTSKYVLVPIYLQLQLARPY